MYEFWYDYIKPKYQDIANLCYMDTDRFITHIRTEDVYEDIMNDVERSFNTSNYNIITIRKNEKVLRLMKDQLGGWIVMMYVGLRSKTYS